MRGSVVAGVCLVVGWGLVVGGVAALTTPWVWALGGGVALLVVGSVALAAEVRDRQDGG